MAETMRIFRLHDTYPCVPAGTPRTVNTDPGGVPISLMPISGTGEEGDPNPELYRMHTRAHLYFEEQVHAADDARLALLPADHTDWDCNRCKHTVHAPDGTRRCPRCYALTGPRL